MWGVGYIKNIWEAKECLKDCCDCLVLTGPEGELQQQWKGRGGQDPRDGRNRIL